MKNPRISKTRKINVSVIHSKFSKALLFPLAAGILLIIAPQGLIYAQSGKDTSSSKQPNDTASNEPPAADHSQMYSALNLQMEYVHWTTTGIIALADEAEKKGLTATAEEISLQAKAIDAVFPGLKPGENQLSKEVIARKYCRALPKTELSKEDLKKAYASLQEKYPNAKKAALMDVQPMVETRALSEKPSVQAAIKKLSEPEEKNKK